MIYIEVKSNKIIRNTFNNFRWNLRAVLFFEVVYKILALFIFIPVNYYILQKAILKTGAQNITNKDLVRFALSIQGIVSITLIVLVSFIAIFIEMAILTYMANKSHKHKRVSLLEATINSFRILPKTISIYMVFLVLLAGIIGPLTGIGLYNSLIKELTIPPFIKIALFKSFSGRVLYGIAIAILLIILIRWILSIPAIVIEDINLKKSFKNSVNIYRNSKYKIMYYLISWVIINFILRAILLIVYAWGGYLLTQFSWFNNTLAKAIIIVYIIIFVIGYVIISVLTLPLFISLLVELYYLFRNYDAKEREFKSIKEYEDSSVYIFIQRYKKYFNVAILIIFIVMIGFRAKEAVVDRGLDKYINVTAHRGSSLKAPENSISSVVQAIKDGADYAEIDVMTTKDNKVVLFHDPNLKRILGDGRRIKDLTLEEVKMLDIGTYFSSDFKGETIPTLEEVFEVADGKIKLNIELKPVDSNDALPVEVSDLIKKYNMFDKVIVCSLDYDALQVLKKHNPVVDIGYVLTFGYGDFTKLNVDFISVEYKMLNNKLISAMHALNKEVHVWTLNNQDQIEDAIRLRVDNIITDSVETVKYVLDTSLNYDVDTLTWFYDSIISIMRYVRI